MFNVMMANNKIRRDSTFFSKNPDSFYNKESVLENLENGNYDFVAVVDSDNLEDVYRLTNNISAGWINNKEVQTTSISSEGFRSSMVGDVFINQTTNKKYVVANCGFVEL